MSTASRTLLSHTALNQSNAMYEADEVFVSVSAYDELLQLLRDCHTVAIASIIIFWKIRNRLSIKVQLKKPTG